jgi:hypothetical protein
MRIGCDHETRPFGTFMAGAQLLIMAPQGGSLAPWGMGLAFGLGQAASAVVLYWNLERKL